jgi:hypothetical protein
MYGSGELEVQESTEGSPGRGQQTQSRLSFPIRPFLSAGLTTSLGNRL